VTLNLVLRYPRTPHETGIDSFFIHTLATNIATDGYAEWILNPLSFFGLYPLSYPSASPFLIAGFSVASGLPLEVTILVLSTLFGVLGMLTSYVMGRELKNDDLFAFSVAFLYSVAPRFLTFTLWTASSRNLFMALAPIFVWAILRTYRRRDAKHAALLASFLLVLMATHRLTILLSVAIIAWVLSLALLALVRVLKLRFPRLLLTPSSRARLPQLTLAAFVALAVFMLFGTNVLDEYRQGELVSGDELQVKLLNLGVSITRSVGLAFPLALIGVVVVTGQRNQGAIQPFILLTLLLLIPTLFLRLYTGFYILPFLVCAGAFGLWALARPRKKRRVAARVLVATVFVAALLVSTAVQRYEAAKTTFPDYADYNTAMYMRVHIEGTVVSNDGLLGIRTAAYSSGTYLPVGGAGTAFQSPELLAFRFYSPEEVQSRVVRVSLFDLTIESDSPFAAPGIQAEADWETMMRTPYGEMPPGLLTRYRLSYFLENEALPGRFTAYGNVYCSDFAFSVRAGAYRVHDSGPESLWFVFPADPPASGGSTARTCR